MKVGVKILILILGIHFLVFKSAANYHGLKILKESLGLLDYLNKGKNKSIEYNIKSSFHQSISGAGMHKIIHLEWMISDLFCSIPQEHHDLIIHFLPPKLCYFDSFEIMVIFSILVLSIELIIIFTIILLKGKLTKRKPKSNFASISRLR